ncbi:hypothetical protein E2C01_017268 [Portunus trituberculatus]|uniref:Uncharacterized protein n=1 Tax=Portunus trituberculatus TaxID=210409 RepID=A0A5B7DR69_PORTR|nr:hypothetical protein [Portunus trituberculatus]
MQGEREGRRVSELSGGRSEEGGVAVEQWENGGVAEFQHPSIASASGRRNKKWCWRIMAGVNKFV